jgi:hypothetical protein
MGNSTLDIEPVTSRGIVALAEAMAQTEEREVTCGGRTYTVRRFPDGLVALYDKGGKLVAGWPQTSLWPPDSLAEKPDEALCAQIKKLQQTY